MTLSEFSDNECDGVALTRVLVLTSTFTCGRLFSALISLAKRVLTQASRRCRSNCILCRLLDRREHGCALAISGRFKIVQAQLTLIKWLLFRPAFFGQSSCWSYFPLCSQFRMKTASLIIVLLTLLSTSVALSPAEEQPQKFENWRSVVYVHRQTESGVCLLKGNEHLLNLTTAKPREFELRSLWRY